MNDKKNKFIKIIEKAKDKIVLELSDEMSAEELSKFSLTLFVVLIDKIKQESQNDSEFGQEMILELLKTISGILTDKDDINSNSLFEDIEINDKDKKMAETFSKVFKEKSISFLDLFEN